MTKTKRFMSVLLVALVMAAMLIPMSVSAVQSSLIDTTQTGSLDVYKYEMSDVSAATSAGTGEATDANNVPSGAKPLKDVTFTIKKVANISPTYYTASGVALPTVSEAKALPVISTTSQATDATGHAIFSNLPLGIYLVQETANPSNVTAKVADFVVSVPMTNTAETGWNYNVKVYPKNETKYAEISLLKTDYASANTKLSGAVFTLQQYYNGSWVNVETGLTTNSNGVTAPTSAVAVNYPYRFIETTAPTGYINDRTAIKYFYVDENGNICDYDNHSTIVNRDGVVTITNTKPKIQKYIDKSNGNNTAASLVDESTYGYNQPGNDAYYYYTIEVTTPNVDMTKMSKFIVTDTVAGRYGSSVQLNSITEKETGTALDSSQYTFANSNGVTSITFKTGTGSTVKKNTAYYISIKALLRTDAGTTLTNNATVEYSTDTDDPTASSTITSNTTNLGFGGYQLLKVNPSNQPLSGVEFKLYSTLSDAQTGTNPVTAYTGSSGTTSGSTFTTDSNGYLNINGIYYGDSINGSKTYYLVETKTNSGYNLLKEPIEIVVNKNSHQYSSTGLKVTNSVKTVLPVTGGYGAMCLYIVGGILILVGGTFLIVKTVRNKKKTTSKE